MRAITMRTLFIVIGALGLLSVSPSCSKEEQTWKEQWQEIRRETTFAPECSMEVCDQIEQGYYPECECWCYYDGDEGEEGDDGGGGDDPSCGGSDDVGGGDCPDDGGGDTGGDEPGGDEPGGDEPGGDEPGDDDGDGDGCTYTQGYWKNHNEFRTNRNQAIDWPAPHDELDQMCGQTLLAIFDAHPAGEAWYILAHQFIAASLNAASGADASGISAELAQAEELLLSSCDGIAAADRATAIELSEFLDAYNNGVVGPGHCHD